MYSNKDVISLVKILLGLFCLILAGSWFIYDFNLIKMLLDAFFITLFFGVIQAIKAMILKRKLDDFDFFSVMALGIIVFLAYKIFHGIN